MRLPGFVDDTAALTAVPATGNASAKAKHRQQISPLLCGSF